MRRLARLSPALFLAASPLVVPAQEVPGPRRLPAAGPARHYRLELDGGGLERLLDAAAPPGAVLECFANSLDADPTGPFGPTADALLVGAGDEVVDWGVKWCGTSGLVESITIGYGSQAPVAVGGSTILRVYAGTQGFGSLGAPVFTTVLTGLPSDGGQIPLIPMFVTLELGSQSFFLPDGPVGWGFQNLDGKTAPLMVDVHPSTSTQNYLDWYRPGPASAGFLEETFSLGPGGFSNDPYENSLYLVLGENLGLQQASLFDLASANPVALSAGAPVLGTTWDFTFDLAGLPGTTATQVLLATAPALPALATPFGEVLVDPGVLIPTQGSSGGEHSFDLTSSATLLGLTFYAQGLAFDAGGPTLTNGLAGTVGF